MAAKLKLASNLCPFSRLCDRFIPDGYTEDYELHKKLEMLAEIDGISGTGFGWPGPFKNGTEIKKLLGDFGLKCCTLDTNVYADAIFKHGSLSNQDSAIRREAIKRGKSALDVAEEAGAPDINFWLGQDGFEYPFQGHYLDAWKWIAEGLTEIAEHNPGMRISVEPKCKEPRAFEYVANTGKALMLVNKINKPNLGITLDFGHSLAALENPSEAAVLTMMEGRLQQVHLNDNYRDWDHDLVPGAVNVWDHIEFFYWLRKLGYEGWFCIDIYPYRDEGAEVVKRTVQVVQKCNLVVDKLLKIDTEGLIRSGKHLEVMRILWDMVG